MPPRVLLVEHDRAICRRLRPHLKGCIVMAAKSGAIALQAVVRTTPDLILTDVNLPQMDGYELVGRLRARRETRDIPVLFFTTEEAGGTPRASETWPEYVVREGDMKTLGGRIAELVSRSEQVRAAQEALSAIPVPTGAMALSLAETRALSEAGFSPDAKADPAPIARQIAMHASLLKSSLHTKEAARHLGVNPSRIRQRLGSHPPTLYGIRLGAEWLLPAFQFTRTGLVPNVEKVIASLDPGLDPVTVYQWIELPDSDLVEHGQAVSPLTWLKSGRPFKRVAELAGEL